MKKALIVANLAGFAIFLLSDIDILQEMGYQVVYAANGKSLAWADTRRALEDRNVEFYQIDFDSKRPLTVQNYHAYRQITELLKKEDFDLIHCHTPIPGLIVRMSAIWLRRKGTKILYTTHGFSFTSKSSWKQRLIYQSIEKICSYFCDGIITINREDFEAARKMHCKKVFYIHGVGVDTSKYQNVEIDKAAYRESIGVKEHELMVLSVGELSDRKNHQIIIKALSKIKTDKKYVYVICGNGINGGIAEQLRNLADEKNVRLLLLGFRFDIPQLMKCSDVGAIPSIREGLGLSGIQSLAAGVPIVGTDVQGIRDYVIHNETGLLCEAFDVDSFAEAIEQLASMSTQERETWKTRCQEKAKEFDENVSIKERIHIYRRYLG